jgi:membrane protein
VAGFFFGREAVSGQVASSITGMLGDTGAKAVQAMLADARRPREGLLATVLGVGTLLFAAIGVVVQLKDALNAVWEVGDIPGHGVWHSCEAMLFHSLPYLPSAFSSWYR